MTAMSICQSLTDRLTVIQIIRRIFDRSPVFQDADISEPRLGLGGEVIVDVSFDRGPAAFRVVAPTAQEAYAILHELATAMVEVERSRHGWNGNGKDDRKGEAVSADIAGFGGNFGGHTGHSHQVLGGSASGSESAEQPETQQL